MISFILPDFMVCTEGNHEIADAQQALGNPVEQVVV